MSTARKRSKCAISCCSTWPAYRPFLERSTQQIGRLEWLSTNLLDLSRIDELFQEEQWGVDAEAAERTQA
ncbi:MAG: hypothetical protein B7Z12_21780, partial [Caulobacter vibrioides]